MDATEAPAAGAGLLRRLRPHAGDVLFVIATLVAAWFLWPSSLGGCTTLTIVSGRSMEPTYYTGDLVVSRCGASEVGDVVVYNPPNVGKARVIHRIIGGTPQAWTIQGDNNDFVDPWQPSEERVLGHAVLRIPKVGTLGAVLVSPITWISFLLVAAALLIWPSREPEGESDADTADAEPEPEPAPEPTPEPVPAATAAGHTEASTES